LKKLLVITWILGLFANLTFAEVTEKLCKKEDVISVLNEGFGSFAPWGYGEPVKTLVAREPLYLDFNGKKIMSLMTLIDIKMARTGVVETHTYNFFFDADNCKFLNGMTISQNSELNIHVIDIPKKCNQTEVFDQVKNIVKKLQEEGKDITKEMFPQLADYSRALRESSRFAIYEYLVVDGKPNVLMAYFDAENCSFLENFLSEQIPYKK
jgi:hypothetical protein